MPTPSWKGVQVNEDVVHIYWTGLYPNCSLDSFPLVAFQVIF